jgi:hypothetical protein
MLHDFDFVSGKLNIELFGVVFLKISVLFIQKEKMLLGGE